MSRRLVVTALVVLVLLMMAYLSRADEGPAQARIERPSACRGGLIPDSLRIMLNSEVYPAYSLSNATYLQRAVHDRVLVRQLFTAVCTLPAFPRGVMACRRDLGVTYDLDFRRDEKRVIHAVAQATGCQEVLIDTVIYPYASTPQFWSLLALSIGKPGRV